MHMPLPPRHNSTPVSPAVVIRRDATPDETKFLERDLGEIVKQAYEGVKEMSRDREEKDNLIRELDEATSSNAAEAAQPVMARGKERERSRNKRGR